MKKGFFIVLLVSLFGSLTAITLAQSKYGDRAQPLYKQLGFRSPAEIAGVKLDFGFTPTVEEGTGRVRKGQHHNTGPDDPIGCLKCDDSFGIIKGGLGGQTVGNFETVWEKLVNELPQELYDQISNLLVGAYEKELAALRIRDRFDLLNASIPLLRKAGAIMRKYDISIGCWDPALVILQERLKAVGIHDLNAYQLDNEGLNHASQVVGFDVKNCNYQESLQKIRERNR